MELLEAIFGIGDWCLDHDLIEEACALTAAACSIRVNDDGREAENE